MIQRKQTLSEIVSSRIKTYITENNCQPGDRLPSEKEIIEMLGVSRTIVREALKTLQSNGIIEIKQGVGIFVKEVQLQSLIQNIYPFLQYDKTKFKEFLDTRIILELGAIELAINHYQLDKINQMSFWNDAFFEKATKGEKPKKEDLFFHRSLFIATGNETFIQLSSIITDYFNANKLEMVTSINAHMTSFKEHKLVVDSIISKDITTAKQTMKEHLNRLYSFIED
jgi:GntR family transcriptional repressor for pyruvate dehydrogenase complex